MNLSTIAKRSKSAAGSAWRPAWKTAKWLLKITIPVSFVVFLLNFTGVLQLLAEATNPFFSLLGLPSQTALVLITSMLTNVYSVIAVISMLGLPVREGLILAVMCLISHGFIIESAVLRKTGSSIFRMLFLRFLSSLVAGVVLGLFLPEFPGVVKGGLPHTVLPFGEAVTAWMLLMARMSLKIIVLITLLMVLQRMMEEFGLLKLLSRWLGPFMRLLGLVPEATLSWLVANAIGLAYGSAIILDEVEKGRLSRREADLLNHHTAISHSQLEDPILFFAIGLPMWWLIWPRFILAVIAVWLRRAELYVLSRMKTQAEGS